MKWSYAVFWAGFILFMSFLPASTLPKSNWFDLLFIDKWVHAFLYFILALFFLHAIDRSEQSVFLKAIFTLSVCIAYGLLIEIFQATLTTSRHFEILDAVADTVGAAAYIAIWFRKKSIDFWKKNAE